MLRARQLCIVSHPVWCSCARHDSHALAAIHTSALLHPLCPLSVRFHAVYGLRYTVCGIRSAVLVILDGRRMHYPRPEVCQSSALEAARQPRWRSASTILAVVTMIAIPETLNSSTPIFKSAPSRRRRKSATSR
ncbi:hypothetical protein PLICRDRAFT_539490 [Plicaturopsis crispa FD-325 SS-3]|nr:hypothetical protein PLICRDRAFT_539490 [Plicaturopsis crispa FD-325 SS-3]